MTIITRSIRVPTPAERLADWAYRYNLIRGLRFTDYFINGTTRKQS